MKKLIGTGRVLFGVVLLAACDESPTEPPEPGPDWVFEGQWGSYGSGNGDFSMPMAVAIAPNGNVYVADCQNHRIQYFTASGYFLGKWGSQGKGNGEFNFPRGIACAPNGNVYVVDPEPPEYARTRIQYFTATGSYLGQWGSCGSGNGQFVLPRGIAVARNGNVYVADTRNHRIQYFTAAGSYLGKWGSEGSWQGQFDDPNGVAAADNGNVYVVDTDNSRIQYFTATGSYLGKWGHGGHEKGQFQCVRGIAVSPFGIVFVTDSGHDWYGRNEVARVQYFNASGSLFGLWGTPGSGEGQFSGPDGVAVSPVSGNVYVADTFNNRIQYFRRK
jgi:DNA-binding beta-propeller fold protein YncE